MRGWVCVLTTPDDGELPDDPRDAQAKVEAAHAAEREAYDAKTDAQEASELAPKKKRKKSTLPAARTMDECRKRGWIAGIVERRIPFPRPRGTTLDLFGVIDIIALDMAAPVGRRTVGIQATTGNGGRHADHRAKILAESRARDWLEAGNRLELWSWAKQGSAGKRKLWTLRVETFTVDDWRST